jgi:hypothetical protein
MSKHPSLLRIRNMGEKVAADWLHSGYVRMEPEHS